MVSSELNVAQGRRLVLLDRLFVDSIRSAFHLGRVLSRTAAYFPQPNTTNKGDVLNCCGKMPSLRRAALPGSFSLPKQLRTTPFAHPLRGDDPDALPDCADRRAIGLPVVVVEPVARGFPAARGAPARLLSVLRHLHPEVGVWMPRSTWVIQQSEGSGDGEERSRQNYRGRDLRDVECTYANTTCV